MSAQDDSQAAIDRFVDALWIEDGLAANTLAAARRVSALQTGYVYHYAFAMLIGVVAFATWYLVRG